MEPNELEEAPPVVQAICAAVVWSVGIFIATCAGRLIYKLWPQIVKYWSWLWS